MMHRFLRSHAAIKAVLFGLLALAPLQVLVIHLTTEPWPSLSLPGFASLEEVPSHFALKEIRAQTAEGTQIDLTWSDLFPQLTGIDNSLKDLNFSPRRKPPDPGSAQGKVMDLLGSIYPFSNYWDFHAGLPHGNDPSVRTWLSQRLSDRFPGETFVSLEFVWYEYEGYVRGTEIPSGAISESYVVSLR